MRGFNLDHGSDSAATVDGMPGNMPTHARGHGYGVLRYSHGEGHTLSALSAMAYPAGWLATDKGQTSAALRAADANKAPHNP